MRVTRWQVHEFFWDALSMKSTKKRLSGPLTRGHLARREQQRFSGDGVYEMFHVASQG